MTIKFDACNGEHTIKREHLDEEGERTLYDAAEFDLWAAGYVKIAHLAKFLARIERHTDIAGKEMIDDFEDFLSEGPAVEDSTADPKGEAAPSDPHPLQVRWFCKDCNHEVVGRVCDACGDPQSSEDPTS